MDPVAVPYNVPDVGKVMLVAAVEVKVVEKLPDRTRAAEALLGIVSVPAVEVMVKPLNVVPVTAPALLTWNNVLGLVPTVSNEPGAVVPIPTFPARTINP